jgi:hypothetical protein
VDDPHHHHHRGHPDGDDHHPHHHHDPHPRSAREEHQAVSGRKEAEVPRQVRRWRRRSKKTTKSRSLVPW